jgi:hypothetical protein
MTALIARILTAGLLAAPLVAFAAPRNFAEVVNVILYYVQLLIPIVFALTFIVLSWGVVKSWIMNDGSAEKVSEGRTLVLYGVIGLLVMSGLWGLLALLRNSFFGF